MADTKTPGKSGLVLDEATIFERSVVDRQGFQLPPLDVPRRMPKKYVRKVGAELPEVNELEVVRHFTRLSSWNYAIDLGPFPLGSCTMKYNPRINEEVAAFSGLADIHPEMPVDYCQGALEIIFRTEMLLSQIVGMDACSVQPAAGAHGEFTGLSMIRAFHQKHGSTRQYVLIPDTAHGTNPASCVLAGYEAITIPTSKAGVMMPEDVQKYIDQYGREVAALMVTNPNTLGLFEQNIVEIAQRVHDVGAQLYMDGANMNAIMGKAKPADMGVDVMQFNLHKTFSTPHGGGGPGGGPVAVKAHLAPFLPGPRVVLKEGKYDFENYPESIGRVKGAYGNFGVVVRALCYVLAHGSEGLKKVSTHAVLNANYLRHRLSKHFEIAKSAPSFHEFVMNDSRQWKGYGVKTLQMAKALIDFGFHPPTVYFPLVVPGAMLVEPTETESLTDLNQLLEAFIQIAQAAESGKESFESFPRKSVVAKVDETTAARRPVLSLDDRISG